MTNVHDNFNEPRENNVHKELLRIYQFKNFPVWKKTQLNLLVLSFMVALISIYLLIHYTRHGAGNKDFFPQASGILVAEPKVVYDAQVLPQILKKKTTTRFAHLISDWASEIKNKIYNIISSKNPAYKTWTNLLVEFRSFASRKLEQKGIEYALDIDPDIKKPLNPKIQEGLRIIFKELLTNAIHHAEATHIYIRLGYEKKELILVIHDNGIGFDPDQADSGEGLEKVKSSASQINAKITCLSNREEGTQWIMSV